MMCWAWYRYTVCVVYGVVSQLVSLVSIGLGGHGGVSFVVQLIGSLGGVLFAVITGFAVYGIVKKLLGLRLTEEEEFNGADLTIHKISSTFNKDMF